MKTFKITLCVISLFLLATESFHVNNDAVARSESGILNHTSQYHTVKRQNDIQEINLQDDKRIDLLSPRLRKRFFDDDYNPDTIHTREDDIKYFLKPNDAKKVKLFCWRIVNNGDIERVEYNQSQMNIENLKLKKEKPFKVIIHGFMSSGDDSEGVNSIATAYAYLKNYNVFTVDWSMVLKMYHILNYNSAAINTNVVGFLIVDFLNLLISEKYVEPSNIHLIGHSLGAHIAGSCGYHFYKKNSKKIGRITGLDPASPDFENGKYQYLALKDTDAEFVDVIHTAGAGELLQLGHIKSIGHVDFYPNGGVYQPGCIEDFIIEKCSHSRAYEYYKESINNENAFMSVQCASWYEYLKRENIENKTIIPMGHYTKPTARGKFCLPTNANSPYSTYLSQKEPPKKFSFLEVAGDFAKLPCC